MVRARVRCGTSTIWPLKLKAIFPAFWFSSKAANSSWLSATSSAEGVNTLVDDIHLVGMNGDFSGKAHPRPFNTFLAEPGAVSDIDEDRIQRLDTRGRCRQQGHNPGITEHFEKAAVFSPVPPGANRGRQILGAPR